MSVSRVKQVDLSQLSKDLAAKGYEEQIPELVKLENPGDSVSGTYVGKGEFESVDPKTGEMKKVPFYTLKDKDGIFRVNGLTILDKGFAALEFGAEVTVIRKADVKSKLGRKAADFSVLAKTT